MSRLARATPALARLRREAAICRRCSLWRNATQTVFGEGPAPAALMLVGEQPGDREDVEGHPFVGPAGLMLDQALQEAGIDRAGVYVTNAVKHFKNEPRGKRRLHKKPNTAEIEACHPWIEAELRAVRARSVMAMGATAARSLLGTNIAIAANRGVRFEVDGRPAWITYHPSAVLRADERAVEIRSAIVDDLRAVASWLSA